MKNNMEFTQRISQSKIVSVNNLVILVSILAVFGTIQMISGGVWDAASHAIKEPERFWSIQHVAVYLGVGMITTSGIFGFFLIKSKTISTSIEKGIKIIIIGAILQLVFGYADSISHDIFGIDGLISLSHQPLELGLVLSSLGGFLILKSLPDSKIKLLIPFASMTLILSISWIVFSIILYFGAVILCIPVYELFSSGCAVL